VPGVPERRGPARGVSEVVVVRAPQLFETLRAFCLGSFRALLADVERGAELPFAFEEHTSYAKPALYEYRPLVKPFIEHRGHTLRQRPDAQLAVEELLRQPAATIFARAHSGPRAREDEALFGSVLLPLLMDTAEICGGFDWDDDAFARAYAELERAVFGERHQYGAVAPVIGLTTGGTTIELGRGIRLRLFAAGELAKLWPEANGLLPVDFGREVDRLSVLELERVLDAGAKEAPDAPGEFADAITAIRLATSAPVAAGPVLFERLDWRPYGIRPVVPIAATQPAGEPGRLDSFRATLATDLLLKLDEVDDDPELGEAIDRWELSRFQDGPFQAEQLRESLAALLGGSDGLWAAAVRGAVLLGETPRARAELQERLSGDPDPDVVRRALVETILHGDRTALVETVNQSILGLRPAPTRHIPSTHSRALAG
jgi:hypothetical protein